MSDFDVVRRDSKMWGEAPKALDHIEAEVARLKKAGAKVVAAKARLTAESTRLRRIEEVAKAILAAEPEAYPATWEFYGGDAPPLLDALRSALSTKEGVG